MKKTFFLITALLCLQLGFTQMGLPQFLAGNWELTSISGEESEYRSKAVVGNRWHFVAEGKLIMENDQGSWTMPVEVQTKKLVFQGQEYPLERTGENSFKIADYTGGILSTVSFQRVMDAEPPVPPKAGKKRGDFQLNGFYYQVEESQPPTYLYFRFYENGEVLQVASVLEPSEITPFLNRAYFSNAKDLRWSVLTVLPEEPQVVYQRAVVPAFSEKETKLISTVTFTPTDDSLVVNEVNRWEDAERTYSRKATLAYYPSGQLATWEGVELTEENPGLAEELFLVRPLPISEIVNKRVEEMPRFPGCEEIEDKDERQSCAQTKLLQFIYQNITYPPIARENGVEGTVVVTFVIERDGTLSNLKIVRDIGAGCGKEALRVVAMMQEQNLRWEPGRVFGKPVRVQFNLPVKFKLEGRTRKKRRRDRG